MGVGKVDTWTTPPVSEQAILYIVWLNRALHEVVVC